MLFSIIIPTYNRVHRIARAINSIINQTYTDWELIIIDDGSTDNTREVCETFTQQDQRIKYIYQENAERCVSRNNGIEHSSGEWICFLDSDDYHLENHLMVLYKKISEVNKASFIFTNAWNSSPDGILSERTCPKFEDHNPYTYFLKYTVNPQRWCIHKSIFENVKFDPDVVICEDMDTSLRVLNAGTPVFQIEEKTTVYVAEPDSFTHGDAKKPYKELFYLKRIFNKAKLKPFLPKKEVKRLLSMCYFHISQKERPLNAIKYSILSFLYFPKGYNGKTNKVLLYTIYSSFLKLMHLKK